MIIRYDNFIKSYNFQWDKHSEERFLTKRQASMNLSTKKFQCKRLMDEIAGLEGKELQIDKLLETEEIQETEFEIPKEYQ